MEYLADETRVATTVTRATPIIKAEAVAEVRLGLRSAFC
jgi:hypothetical protein